MCIRDRYLALGPHRCGFVSRLPTQPRLRSSESRPLVAGDVYKRQGDFLAMALTTDRVRPSPMPNSWQVGRITMAGVTLGGCFLAFCVAVVAVGKFEMQFGIEALRTLSVVAIVYGSQATI